MLCINNLYTDAWFNLAAEEYLLKNFPDSIFMLWQNEPAIIIGKHQNVWDEINVEFMRNKRLKVVRRFSGGGAVYHDAGNLNLTFIENGNSSQAIRITEQITDFLKTLGIKALSDKRQAITINGLKISGSAQSIHKNRTMHHATLLFSTNLKDLSAALSPSTTQEQGEAIVSRSIYVKSVRSPVTNISVHTPKPLSIDEFKHSLMNYFIKNNAEVRNYTFTDNDMNAIRNLRDSKYATPSWNFNIKADNTNLSYGNI